jgi:mannose-6-phosphate isomerase-like protein (cupin superfamily)
MAVPTTPPSISPDLHRPSGTTRLAPSFLLGIAEGIAGSPLWHGLADPGPDGRSAVRIVRAECYEVWVLGWWPGQSVELHDHGYSHAAFTVVEGNLVEVTARPRGGLERLELAAGASRVVPAGTRHDVLNLDGAPATSIHVYSPELTSMTFYDAIDQRPLRVEPVESSPAVWPDVAANRWLHPARAQRA